MSKKKKIVSDEELLFQTVGDDPRAASTKAVEDTIDTNIEDLFTVVGTSNDRAERLDSTPYSYWRLTFKYLFKNPLVIVCLALLVIILFFTFFGTMMRNFPPFKFDSLGQVYYTNRDWGVDAVAHYIAPNSTNWLGVIGSDAGADFEGADMWYCVWKGAQLSLLLGTTVALIDTVVGIAVGAAWGYFRWLDPILIEFRNFVNNIPTLLLDILLMQIFAPYMKQYGFWIITLLLSALGWLGLAGFIRNQIIIIRNREYNIASQTLGTSSGKMITHNLLPYLISVIVTVVSTAIPEAISSEVGLAYFKLSFIASNGDITLGQVLTQCVSGTAWMNHIWMLLGPMVVMAPLTIAFFYLGLALADATDPKTHR